MASRRGRVNTLAHYMAINDDLYCQVIYRKFAMAQDPDKESQQEHAVQAYLRDACRILNLKIY